MKYLSISEAWGIINAHVVPMVAQGQTMGALESSLGDHPYVEFLYSPQTDTLVIGEWDRKPVITNGQPDRPPVHVHEFQQFGETAFGIAKVAGAMVAALPPAPGMGMGGMAGPYGFNQPEPPKSPDDRIGFRPQR